jgi:hypothetical protein
MWRNDRRFLPAASKPELVPVAVKSEGAKPMTAPAPGFALVITAPSGMRVEVSLTSANAAAALVRSLLA